MTSAGPADEGPETAPTADFRHIAFACEYDGSRFHGFQYQTKHHSVQGDLLRVFRSLLHDGFTLRAAGRTDRGVHALGQVVSVRSTATFRWDRLLELANDRLSPYVRLREPRDMPWDFHPRFWARLRHYRYVICEDRSRQGPVLHAYTAFAAGLDWDAVAAAAARLEGERNFTSFCKRPGEEPRLVRRIERIAMVHAPPFRFVDFFGRSFLRGQIRNIMGWLIAIGQGRFPPETIDELLGKTVKDVAVRPAPPEGLYLMQIWYPGDPMPGWWAPPAGPPEPVADDE
jgi:tRNA pseudouridine38-40 synthase